MSPEDKLLVTDVLKQLHDTGQEIDGYFVGRIVDDDDTNVIVLDTDDQRYLEQLNAAVLYAQQAYFSALSYFRRVYGAPEQEWDLNNIDVGFVRKPQNVAVMQEVG